VGLRHCFEIVITAKGEINLRTVLDMVQTLPRDLNEVEEAVRLRGYPLSVPIQPLKPAVEIVPFQHTQLAENREHCTFAGA
jgi:hypothetical protein